MNKYFNSRKLKVTNGGSGKVFIIGVAGASGCGKTYFANTLKNKLNQNGIDNIEIISCDNYYKPYPDGKAPPDFNWDIPESIELSLLYKHLIELKKGKKIEIPKYNFLTSQRDGIDRSIDGSVIKIIIVEGLFVLYDDNLRSMYDLKIFTLLDPDICLARRLQRDIEERGNTYKQTIEQYQRDVKPSYLTFIEPTKKYADIIISTSEYTDTSISIDVLRTYIMTKI